MKTPCTTYKKIGCLLYQYTGTERENEVRLKDATVSRDAQFTYVSDGNGIAKIAIPHDAHRSIFENETAINLHQEITPLVRSWRDACSQAYANSSASELYYIPASGDTWTVDVASHVTNWQTKNLRISAYEAGNNALNLVEGPDTTLNINGSIYEIQMPGPKTGHWMIEVL